MRGRARLGGGPGRGVGGGRGRLTRTRHSLRFQAIMSTRTSSQTAAGTAGSLRFSTIHVVLLVLGLAALAAGYTLLARGSIVAAPLLLVLGYVVLIPLGLILSAGARPVAGLRALSSVGPERFPYKEEVTGSSPVAPMRASTPRRASVAPRGSRHRGACRSSPLAESAMPYDEGLLERCLDAL